LPQEESLGKDVSVKKEQKEQKVEHSVERSHKRIHIALPIRVTCWDKDKKSSLEMACTYDISSRGARITNLRSVKQPGEVVAVERGRNKSYCRVVWIGEPGSEHRGQIGLQAVESERSMWDSELRDMREAFDPIPKETAAQRPPSLRGSRNRRRHDRFEVEGTVEFVKPGKGGKNVPVKAAIKDLSEMGCSVTTKQVLLPGADLKLVLKIANYDLTVKGQVKHSVDMGIGIEFSEIRKGDRQTLKYLLQKLAESGFEDVINVEVQQ
jgi:PilZ domain